MQLAADVPESREIRSYVTYWLTAYLPWAA